MSILSKSVKPPGSGWAAIPNGKQGGYRRRGAGKKYEYWYPGGAQPAEGKTAHHEILKDYKLEIVSNDPKRAKEIATKIKEGIEKTADICKMNPAVCRGNMGVPRSNMPQVMDVSIKEMLQGSESDKKKAATAVAMGADPNSSKSIKDHLLDKLQDRGWATQGHPARDQGGKVVRNG